MENKEAKKRIDTILKDIESNGIVITTLVEQLQVLRPYAVDEKIPLLAKVIRLTFEHLENNEGFFIPIPDDEPIEDEDSDTEDEGDQDENTEDKVSEDTSDEDKNTEEVVPVTTTLSEDFDPADSLSYLISLMKDVKNKINATDLRAYCNALIAYDA